MTQNFEIYHEDNEDLTIFQLLAVGERNGKQYKFTKGFEIPVETSEVIKWINTSLKEYFK